MQNQGRHPIKHVNTYPVKPYTNQGRFAIFLGFVFYFFSVCPCRNVVFFVRFDVS